MIFRSNAHKAAFNRDGFFIIKNFLDNDGVRDVLALYNRIKVDDFDGITSIGVYTNIEKKQEEVNKLVNKEIVKICKKSLDKHFNSYSIGGGIFLLKGAGKNNTPLHQDWNMVDENKYFSLAVWCPAIDVNEMNGCLQVLPTSHQWFNNIRSSNIQSLFIPFDEVKNSVIPIPVKKGDAVIFSHSLFHGSRSNGDASTRPAVCLSLYPEQARQVHYFKDDEEIKIIDSGNDLFITQMDNLKAKDYSNVKVYDSIKYEDEFKTSKEDFNRVLGQSKFRILQSKVRMFFFGGA